MGDTSASQRDISAKGPVAGRDVNQTTNIFNNGIEETGELSDLIRKAAAELEQCQESPQILEALQRYVDPIDGEEVIGLEAKLVAAGRRPEVEKAARLKEDFSKLLHRHALSHSAQQVYSVLLSRVEMLFDQKIRPLIADGATHANIDGAIADDVIETVFAEIPPDNPLGLYYGEVRGMLYFLTGNCHIRWDA